MQAQELERKDAPLIVLASVLVICIVGGTSQAYPMPRAIAQVSGAVIVAVCIARAPTRLPADRWLSGLCLAAAGLIALQAVPLPPSVWSALPGRQGVVELDRTLGWTLWRPLTLDWEASFAAALFLVPLIAMLLAGSRKAWVSSLAGAFAIGGSLAALLAILQALNGDWLRPFATSHEGYAIGPFVNRNHLAMFVTCGALMAIGWAHDGEEARAEPLRSLFGWGALALAGIAILLSGSRSGLAVFGLALLGLAWGWLASVWSRLRASVLTFLAGLAALVALAVLKLPEGALAAASQRKPLGDDRRFEIWPTSADLIPVYWPFGSGFGTFRDVYAAAEPLAQVRALYVNHAHNDFLELAVEGGIVAALLLAGFLAWLGWRSMAFLRRWPGAAPLRGTAVLSLWLIAAQSLVDYPTRTEAIAALAGLCMAIVALPPRDKSAAEGSPLTSY